ncbi:MAG: hypothetical protein LBB43_07510 [Spirochaetaceae bacterium]|jgi:hypothetical protein|nr:hypothetical protein [Spirochaetaceae bacterium]
MTENAWEAFAAARAVCRTTIERLQQELPGLQALQQAQASLHSKPYTVETPIVYNGALDAITPSSTILCILVADNPGRHEQMAANRAYLVGPSGKIAERFFRHELGIDFQREVLILNKCPIHSARTAGLRELARRGGAALQKAIADSQAQMGQILVRMAQALEPAPVWIIGYSEMKKGGIFEPFTETLRGISGFSDRVLLFRHFSMNQFTIDFRRKALPEESVTQTLERIGSTYRKQILG